MLASTISLTLTALGAWFDRVLESAVVMGWRQTVGELHIWWFCNSSAVIVSNSPNSSTYSSLQEGQKRSVHVLHKPTSYGVIRSCITLLHPKSMRKLPTTSIYPVCHLWKPSPSHHELVPLYTLPWVSSFTHISKPAQWFLASFGSYLQWTYFSRSAEGNQFLQDYFFTGSLQEQSLSRQLKE